jgi:hypothetical protein
LARASRLSEPWWMPMGRFSSFTSHSTGRHIRPESACW